jgi:hypothetical protein
MLKVAARMFTLTRCGLLVILLQVTSKHISVSGGIFPLNLLPIHGLFGVGTNIFCTSALFAVYLSILYTSPCIFVLPLNSSLDDDQASEKNGHPVAHFVLQVGEVHQSSMLPA